MAMVLRNAGWSTFWVGKNHNTPVDAWTVGSSKEEWPLGLAYDQFYGFIGGELLAIRPCQSLSGRVPPALPPRLRRPAGRKRKPRLSGAFF